MVVLFDTTSVDFTSFMMTCSITFPTFTIATMAAFVDEIVDTCTAVQAAWGS
jgi:hypothetical protein